MTRARSQALPSGSRLDEVKAASKREQSPLGYTACYRRDARNCLIIVEREQTRPKVKENRKISVISVISVWPNKIFCVICDICVTLSWWMVTGDRWRENRQISVISVISVWPNKIICVICEICVTLKIFSVWHLKINLCNLWYLCDLIKNLFSVWSFNFLFFLREISK